MVGQDEWFLNFKRSLIHSKISAERTKPILYWLRLRKVTIYKFLYKALCMSYCLIPISFNLKELRIIKINIWLGCQQVATNPILYVFHINGFLFKNDFCF